MRAVEDTCHVPTRAPVSSPPSATLGITDHDPVVAPQAVSDTLLDLACLLDLLLVTGVLL